MDQEPADCDGMPRTHIWSLGRFLAWAAKQLNTWVRMVSPDTAVFIAQATPWSPGTNGPVTGSVVRVNAQEEKDLDQYKGKLAGKIVLLGEMRPVPPVLRIVSVGHAQAFSGAIQASKIGATAAFSCRYTPRYLS